jgi:hypothetical protein
VLASDTIGQWLLRKREREGARSVYLWLRQPRPALPALEDDLTLVVLDCGGLAPTDDRPESGMRR